MAIRKWTVGVSLALCAALALTVASSGTAKPAKTQATSGLKVALVTDGPPLLLNVGEAPTFVDPDAAVCWSANLQINLKTDIGMKALLGRTSGEEFQLGFQGQGFVIVQPSENMRFGGAQDGGQQVQQQGALGGLSNLLR